MDQSLYTKAPTLSASYSALARMEDIARIAFADFDSFCEEDITSSS